MALLLVVICQMQKYYIRQSLKENTERRRLMGHKMFSGYICFCVVNYAVYPIEQFQSSVGILVYLASETTKFYHIDL